MWLHHRGCYWVNTAPSSLFPHPLPYKMLPPIGNLHPNVGEIRIPLKAQYDVVSSFENPEQALPQPMASHAVSLVHFHHLHPWKHTLTYHMGGIMGSINNEGMIWDRDRFHENKSSSKIFPSKGPGILSSVFTALLYVSPENSGIFPVAEWPKLVTIHCQYNSTQHTIVEDL